jgi:hypothetical protein
MIKKKGQYSKFIVTVVIVLNILFTAAVLYVFAKTGSEPSTLITTWFTFTVGELLMLTSIKKTKVKKENKEE